MSKDIRVDFKTDSFNKQIDYKGYNLIWSKNVPCPNRDTIEKEDHDLNCTLCERGFIFYNAKEIKGIITGINTNQLYEEEGRYDKSDCNVTVKSENHLHYWDKIEMIDSKMLFTEMMKRGETVLDKFRYKILDVEYCVDGKGTLYTKDVDFVITSDGKIDWSISEDKLQAGAIYSMSYLIHPVYVIMNYPHRIRNTYLKKKLPAELLVEMPIQGLMRLEFLAR